MLGLELHVGGAVECVLAGPGSIEDLVHHSLLRNVSLRLPRHGGPVKTAEALAISISTLKQEWQFAEGWLFSELHS